MLSVVEKLKLYRHLRQANKDGRWVQLYYSTEADCPTCGFDELSQNAVKLNCPTCKGRGRVYTTYESNSLARIVWRTKPELTMDQGGEIYYGDVILIVDPREKRAFDALIQTETGYVKVDSRTVKPVLVHTIAGSSDLLVLCQLVNREALLG